MITVEQCRGARGLLGWTQQDLADASGLSKTAINNFEKQHSDIKADSLRSIRLAFEAADIQFIGTAGITMKTEDARILRGPDALSLLLDDIYSSIEHSKDKTLLITFPKEESIRTLPNHKLLSHQAKLSALKIDQRVLYASEDYKPLEGPSSRTLRIDPNNSSVVSRTTFLYANKVAIELRGQSMTLLIDSQEAYKAECRHFETLWATTEKSVQSLKKAALA